MKKIIKLTESDLTRIVKRVIKENDAKMDLIDTIKNEGFKSASEMVGGDKNLIKVLGVKTPMDFLNLFNDLDVVQSKENPDWTLFRHVKGNNIVIYNKENGKVYVNFFVIWSFLDNNFGLKYGEIQEVIKDWLGEAYNLRGITPVSGQPFYSNKLDEVYNLRNRI
jgi:hypothetical protein